MTLGKQFENTYWHDGDGVTNFSLKHKYSESNPDEALQYPSNPDLEPDTPYISDESKDSLSSQLSSMSGDFDEQPHLQGMLFSPYTGTGLKKDPLVPTHERERAVKEVLGQNPRKNSKYIKSSRYTDPIYSGDEPNESLHEQRGESLSNSLYHSDIPIHELHALEDKDLVATLHYPNEDSHLKKYKGYYTPSDKTIKVRDDSNYRNIPPSATGTTMSNTLLHEYGHARDYTSAGQSNKADKNLQEHSADPVEEAMADAYSDRYSRYAGKLESGRESMEDWDVSNTGYTGKSDRWNRDNWIDGGRYPIEDRVGTRTAGALYAATRLISARSDRGMASIPKHLAGGNEEEVLAQLWEDNPEIHSTMNKIEPSLPQHSPNDPRSMGEQAAMIHARHFDPQASRREAFGKSLESGRRLEAHERPPVPSAKYDQRLPLEGI